MNWTGVLEKYGWKQEVVGNEPFTPLAAACGALRSRNEPVARVSATVGTASDYGGVKVSFTVAIDTIQSESAINLAGEAVFLKAVELVNDSTSLLGIPPLELR